MHRRQRRCAARQCKRDIRRSVLRNGMVQTGHRASSAHTPRLWHQHQHLQTGCPPPCAHEVRLQRSRCRGLFSVVFDAVSRYDYVVVGHFLPWKRSWTILQKSGRRLAIGEVYVTNVSGIPQLFCLINCLTFGIVFVSSLELFPKAVTCIADALSQVRPHRSVTADGGTFFAGRCYRVRHGSCTRAGRHIQVDDGCIRALFTVDISSCHPPCDAHCFFPSGAPARCYFRCLKLVHYNGIPFCALFEAIRQFSHTSTHRCVASLQ